MLIDLRITDIGLNSTVSISFSKEADDIFILPSKSSTFVPLILDEIIGELYNSKKMIRFIYGRKWNDLDKETKNKLGLTFQKYISFNYVKRFNNIQNFVYIIGT